MKYSSIQVVVAVILLAVLTLMIVRDNAPTQQVATVTEQQPFAQQQQADQSQPDQGQASQQMSQQQIQDLVSQTQQMPSFVPGSPTKKVSKKKITKPAIKKPVKVVVKKAIPRSRAPLVKGPQAPQAAPDIVVNQQKAFISADSSETDTPIEADCQKVLSIQRPHPLESVGGIGGTIAIRGVLQNCNWIPTKMPRLFVHATDAIGDLPNHEVTPTQQVYLPGSMTASQYDFSLSLPITSMPTSTSGYLVFSGTNSAGYAIRTLPIPIAFN